MVGTMIEAERIKLLANIKFAQDILFEEKETIENGEYLLSMDTLQMTYDDLMNDNLSDDSILEYNSAFMTIQNKPKVEIPKSNPIPIEIPPMNLSLTFEVLNFVEN